MCQSGSANRTLGQRQSPINVSVPPEKACGLVNEIGRNGLRGGILRGAGGDAATGLSDRPRVPSITAVTPVSRRVGANVHRAVA